MPKTMSVGFGQKSVPNVRGVEMCFSAQMVKKRKNRFRIQEISGHNRVEIRIGLSKAARPFNSRFDKHKLVENGFEPFSDWKDAVERFLKI